MAKTFREEALFELNFWLQVLGDHGRFIYDSLSPGETEYVETADYFIKRYDQLLAEARRSLNDKNLMTLLKQANDTTFEFRKLKLAIIRDQLVGDVKITLPTTFLNHMVNELEEALRLFSFLLKREPPPEVHPLHHDLLWLLDAAGHSGAINDNLDHVEYDLKLKSERFKNEWEDFYIKAVELAGYLRSNITQFPALSKFHKDIELEMEVFKAFLRELEEMRLGKEVLGVLTPLMADHMAREECYYLMKLAETTELSMPQCDPTKPRTE
ncbi:hypothetical protein J2S74_004383 [Evansella vedderi]|uniref:DUF2935 domain-containing protein n=1 Tax=Evansella vedderi TaxID=38282 RepID=A0ABU0A0C3_9BACI|nr:DUF2935 domain-containing protein [Evansella vedderi]MDQ0256938.1 hypothetical protein [Evansella vedderi]